MSNQKQYGRQTKDTWKALAHKCASETIDDLQERLIEDGEKPLNAFQKTMTFAMILASIRAAFHAVAEEAVKGEDVSGALMKESRDVV